MNVSINSSHWHSPFSELIPKSLDVAESWAGSSNLDVMETSIDPPSVALRLALPIALISLFCPYPIATLVISFLGLWLLSQHDYVQAKKILTEKKIAQIITESAGKPKKALIIQSTKDRYGALLTRTHVEKVRQLAKTHSIEKVVVNTEKEFLTALPSGRFDLVWVRAHGTPNSIEIGHNFKLSKDSAPQTFHTLASKIKYHGKLLLECCDVGNNRNKESCLAEHIASYCWDATVYAPLSDISGIFGLEFDKWGSPQFNNSFGVKGRNVTRIIDGPKSHS